MEKSKQLSSRRQDAKKREEKVFAFLYELCRLGGFA
jgi:hypothetical protein